MCAAETSAVSKLRCKLTGNNCKCKLFTDFHITDFNEDIVVEAFLINVVVYKAELADKLDEGIGNLDLYFVNLNVEKGIKLFFCSFFPAFKPEGVIFAADFLFSVDCVPISV